MFGLFGVVLVQGGRLVKKVFKTGNHF